MKPLAHAVIITAVLNAANLFAKPTGLAILMRLVQPGGFAIYGASVAASLHDRKAMVFLVLGCIILLGSPTDLEKFARLLIPEGLGIITGTLARRLIIEETT